MKEKKCFYWALLSIILCGCSAPIRNLQALSKNIDQTQKYIDGQENKFKKLVADLQNNGLEKGFNKENILAKYGEPIFQKLVEINNNKLELWLYRRPVNISNSDRVYLYFDQQQLLDQWDLNKIRYE